MVRVLHAGFQKRVVHAFAPGAQAVAVVVEDVLVAGVDGEVDHFAGVGLEIDEEREHNVVWTGRHIRPLYDPRDPDPARRYKGMTRVTFRHQSSRSLGAAPAAGPAACALVCSARKTDDNTKWTRISTHARRFGQTTL